MQNPKWHWVYVPYLDPPERQHETASNVGYAKVYFKYDVDAEIRKAKHALWAYRAMIAKRLKESFGIRALYNPLLCSEEHKWEIVERKCRVKVKEYE